MNGFSLLELVVVLAILAAVTAVAAPRIVRGKRERDSVTKVVAQFGAQQRIAVSSARDVIAQIGGTAFTFSPAGIATPDTATLLINGRPHHVSIDIWSGDVTVR